MLRVTDKLVSLLAPLFTITVLFLTWYAAVTLFKPPSHLIPSPDDVLLRLWSGIVGGDMLPHIGATITASLIGYCIGVAIALSLAILLTEFPVLENSFYPLVLCFQSIPKVSIAPLVFVWVGFGMQSQVALVALICFFPLFTSAFAGLKSVDPNLSNMFRVSNAGRLHTMLHLRIPSAAPQLFVGLEISASFALVGCVVMEFINATQGTGFLIVNSSNTLDTTTSIAAMFALGILGLISSALVRAAGQKIVFWHRPATNIVNLAPRSAL
ncbi:ABC transporter permease [Microvirga rosea]|uniref:ABC transporter permease n=1 Tax=Microvirga rosea TaxID=2715425 RepID=UPI001D0B5502|nr:ABC transporter permease [Microvirga rosea]MCB8823194.1 ABC transporter permease [Microvirga rosea]